MNIETYYSIGATVWYIRYIKDQQTSHWFYRIECDTVNSISITSEGIEYTTTNSRISVMEDETFETIGEAIKRLNQEIKSDNE